MRITLALTCAAMMLLLLAPPAWSQAVPDTTERDVFGTLCVTFMLSSEAVMPRPPFEVSMQIDSESGKQQTFRLKDPKSTWWMDSSSGLTVGVFGESFAVSLVPGHYSMVSLLVKAADFSPDGEIALATRGPDFTVTPAPCTYIGRVNQQYIRVEPGDKGEQDDAVSDLSGVLGRELKLVYTARGGFAVPGTATVGVPPPSDTLLSGLPLYKQVKARGCTESLASSSAALAKSNAAATAEAKVREPFYAAITQGATDQVSQMLEKGADPNMTDREGLTPLMAAAVAGQIEVAELLLAKGAKIDAAERTGNTALLMAVVWQQPGMVRFLLGHGADVKRQTRDGLTALHLSISQVDLPSAKVLIEAGADVNAATALGLTPLMFAANNPTAFGADCVRLLLEHKADPNLRAPDGTTALKNASQSGNPDVLRLLKAAGAKK